VLAYAVVSEETETAVEVFVAWRAERFLEDDRAATPS